MASLAAACRASARLARRPPAARRFTTAPPCLAAHNFIMPALSPTMTEGKIASWKVKEGEPYSAGDVLLEIETDKATMDVEAQDDGVVMRIMARDGSKSVHVGTRIAVLADPGDDLGALELPPDERPQQQQQQQQQTQQTQTQTQTPARSQPPARDAAAPPHEHTTRPLMPAVEHLVRQHGLGHDDVARIKPTGPAGRLLKGDVLAFLGAIDAASPAAVSSRAAKLAHLDLSNIRVVARNQPVPPPAAPPPEPLALEVKVPVSLAEVVHVQKRIQDSLGVFMPLSTFVSRAAEVANEELPLAAREPTASELFDQVLGLDKVKAAKGSRGVYLPQISAVPPPSMLAPRQPRPQKRDIIDELAAGPRGKSAPRPSATATPTVPGLSSGANVFSLVVPREEAKRAHVFLERCKAILEREPGQLVL